MIKVYCEKCKEELEDHGGLLFSPPVLGFNISPVVDKYHLCPKCWWEVYRFVTNKD